jgi:hypothetical protein
VIGALKLSPVRNRPKKVAAVLGLSAVRGPHPRWRAAAVQTAGLRVANPNPTSAEIDQNQEPALEAVLWLHLREEGSK